MSGEYKKLYRSRANRMLGGVCGGIGEYLGTDPTLIRVGFVVASLLGWIGAFVLLYLILWIVVPEEPVQTPTTSM